MSAVVLKEVVCPRSAKTGGADIFKSLENPAIEHSGFFRYPQHRFCSVQYARFKGTRGAPHRVLVLFVQPSASLSFKASRIYTSKCSRAERFKSHWHVSHSAGQ